MHIDINNTEMISSSTIYFMEQMMPAVTIRNLPEATHRALKARAAAHGRSTEAEIRDILETAVKPAQRVRLGDALAALGRKVGLTNEDFAVFEQARDKAPAKPMGFE
jgi:plasmid stability protein